MFGALLSALVACAALHPKVWVVDTGAVQGAGAGFSITLTFESNTGRATDLTRAFGKDAEAIDVRTSFAAALAAQPGWKVEQRGALILIHTSGGRPFERLTVTGTGPTPIVRWSFDKRHKRGMPVEFDFSNWAPPVGAGQYSLAVTVLIQDEKAGVSKTLTYNRAARLPVNAATVCAAVDQFFRDEGLDSEIVDKTKLRVYGRVSNNKLTPVTKGLVESADLKPNELPKVTNPKNEG